MGADRINEPLVDFIDHDEEVRVVQRADGRWVYEPLECGACPAPQPGEVWKAKGGEVLVVDQQHIDARHQQLRPALVHQVRGLTTPGELANAEQALGKPICTNCNGTGIAPFPPPPAADRCWWCEGRGHRL